MAQGAEIAPGSSLHPSALLKPSPAGNWISHCQPITDSHRCIYGLVIISGFCLIAKEASDPKPLKSMGTSKPDPRSAMKGPALPACPGRLQVPPGSARR